MTDTNDVVTLRRILTNYTRVAVVGLSAKPLRPSYLSAKYMLLHGFTLTPVNPNYGQILGQTCYPDLTSIPHSVEIVNLFQRVEQIPPFVDQAIGVGVFR